MTETPEALRARLERWLRDGYTDNETPLDGYGREVVREVMVALSSRPEGDAASALSPDVRERLQALEARWRERSARYVRGESSHSEFGRCEAYGNCADELRDVLAARPSESPPPYTLEQIMEVAQTDLLEARAMFNACVRFKSHIEADPPAVTGGSPTERKGEMHTCPVCGPECSC